MWSCFCLLTELIFFLSSSIPWSSISNMFSISWVICFMFFQKGSFVICGASLFLLYCVAQIPCSSFSCSSLTQAISLLFLFWNSVCKFSLIHCPPYLRSVVYLSESWKVIFNSFPESVPVVKILGERGGWETVQLGQGHLDLVRSVCCHHSHFLDGGEEIYPLASNHSCFQHRASSLCFSQTDQPSCSLFLIYLLPYGRHFQTLKRCNYEH